MAVEPLLRVSGLTKRYGQFTALQDVSFEVRRGEVLGLIGPNGSGKTTLFECVGGLLPFDAGTITPVPAGLAFYLPDAVAPWPTQTVAWCLSFIEGLFAARADARPRAVAALGIEPLMTVRMGELSKGQRKRVLLALGLLTPHPILMADEPFEGLDLRQTREVARVLRDVATEGRTLFLSIHQIADASRVCDRFVLLGGGRIRGEGTLSELGDVAAARGVTNTSDLEEVFLALT
jgi:ABC-type multidrug transport system ATPase subunit